MAIDSEMLSELVVDTFTIRRAGIYTNPFEILAVAELRKQTKLLELLVDAAIRNQRQEI